MVLTESTMLALGTTVPDFTLPDTTSDEMKNLQELKSDKATLIMFICNHCPYVQHIQDQLSQLAKDYSAKGIAFVAISANDAVNYPDDSPENMKRVAAELDYTFPYLYDKTQETAKAYKAACTPDFFVIDGAQKLIYRGRLDGSSPGNDTPVTGDEMRAVFDSILADEPISEDQKPSIGCNIKWV